MTTNEYLQAILSAQVLKDDSAELKELQSQRAKVEKLIRDEFGSIPIIRYGGSKAKGTLIKEAYDLDIVCYLPADSDVHTHRRYRYKNGIDEEERAKNRTKSSVRSKVEHVFQVMKLKFGFVKLRYRGLKKNAHQLFVICGLVNLFLSRQKLLTASA
jgi:tRNA nucleotidyltransferase (CCA-adding enzyme)